MPTTTCMRRSTCHDLSHSSPCLQALETWFQYAKSQGERFFRRTWVRPPTPATGISRSWPKLSKENEFMIASHLMSTQPRGRFWNLVRDGHLLNLIHAGARVHQAGCNGCIGMGQA